MKTVTTYLDGSVAIIGYSQFYSFTSFVENDRFLSDDHSSGGALLLV
jgi:hypothetical protein